METVRLDDYVPVSLARVHLVELDVEGGEREGVSRGVERLDEIPPNFIGEVLDATTQAWETRLAKLSRCLKAWILLGSTFARMDRLFLTESGNITGNLEAMLRSRRRVRDGSDDEDRSKEELGMPIWP